MSVKSVLAGLAGLAGLATRPLINDSECLAGRLVLVLASHSPRSPPCGAAVPGLAWTAWPYTDRRRAVAARRVGKPGSPASPLIGLRSRMVDLARKKVLVDVHILNVSVVIAVASLFQQTFRCKS